MNNAFIFDIDGVIVDSESRWVEYSDKLLREILGDELREKIGSTTGVGARGVYDKAVSHEFTMPERDFQQAFDQTALDVYENAEITPDVEKLVEFLLENDIKLGAVTASPRNWIDVFRHKVPFLGDMECIYLNDRKDLACKPDPEGYNEMMRTLNAAPETTTVLEDSNHGITAGMASGAFTIAFTQNLIQSYEQKEADAKADTMQDVIEIVQKRLQA